MSGSRPSGSPTSVTLTPTVPTPLARLYAATQATRASLGLPPLPTISTLLQAAMRDALLTTAGLLPGDLPPPPSPTRTTAATAARSRKRLARKSDVDPTDGA